MTINNIIENFLKMLPQMKIKTDENGKREKPNDFQIAIHIIENSKDSLISTGGKLYIYHLGKYFEINGAAKTKHFVKRCIQTIFKSEHVPAKSIENVCVELNTYYYELTHYKGDNSTFINMKSTVIEIKKDGTITTHPHNKKYNFTYQLNYDYDEHAKAPTFEKFLNTSLEDEGLKNISLEYLAYIIDQSSKNYEKALFLYGSGSNGKSTFLNIIKHLFGLENISHVELTQMSDKNECAMMDGKLLNISSDANKKGLDTGIFKKVVSGEPISGKYLFKDVYTIFNLPKLIVAMNKLPYHNGDNTLGFYRRLILIPFNKTIKEEDKDYYLEKKIVENELPGVFNLVIEALIRLNNQGGFSKSKIADEITNNYIESANHVPTFIEEECYEDVPNSSKEGTPLKTLFEDFKRWCLELGHNPYNANYLATELENLGFKSYKNSTKHFRIVKKKLANETGFTTIQNEDSPYSGE